MVRYCAVALLLLAPTAAGAAQAAADKGKPEKDLKFEDKLTKDDPAEPRRQNAPRKVFPVKMKAGRTYTIDMVSAQFDSYLFLEDGKGNELAQDDDSGGMLNARIIFNCPADGDYKVICTAYNTNGAGMFTLTVKTAGAVKQTSAHTLLMDKAAPDFQGDFAVNGKAGRVSDLKGKVVLLQFLDVRSAECAGTFPRLSAWSKTHKAAGLEVVAVTYYSSDIGQRLAFDPKTGQFKHVAEAGRESDRALLKQFAAHHKVDYLLTALPMEEALKAFDAYAVNGLPQFVLIDRKGMVRSVQRNPGENAAAGLEADLKKLLAEK